MIKKHEHEWHHIRSARENEDEFGRIPFHLNPSAYTRPENYLSLTLALAGGADNYQFWYCRH